MELVKWQYRSPYSLKQREHERLFVFGAHTVVMQQQPHREISLQQNTGFLVWDGAYILAKFLYARLHLRGKRCVELGAGGALVSIVARLAGAARVVATDMPEYLDFIRTNVGLNSVGTSTRRVNLRLKPKPEAEAEVEVEVRELVWGHPVSPDLLPVDVVFGSEILYLSSQHTALLHTLSQLMQTNHTVGYFIYKHRNLQEQNFATLAQEQGFSVKELPQAMIDSEFHSESYALLKIMKVKM
ncbi:putative methyltransferase-domain-containing protein [Kickxella alabastrina]|uniref:putative methyltransferase-domain-containing protein n=1 Tax=Kickxella alabastrina TaxID=61397 RepID=UPI00222115AC|nr:putative methyltransferase-domain-containing protein [Kickxella alabastrina]KAI7823095.1 putative methyltransferase-domain-containing protein [Kickxella alabastrina]